MQVTGDEFLEFCDLEHLTPFNIYASNLKQTHHHHAPFLRHPFAVHISHVAPHRFPGLLQYSVAAGNLKFEAIGPRQCGHLCAADGHAL